VRNYAASPRLATLGTIVVSVTRSHATSSLLAKWLPAARAQAEASKIAVQEAAPKVDADPVDLTAGGVELA
jgi:hypothetical protein